VAVLVHDVELPASAAALLALLLHRAGQEALSERVGRAVDTDKPGLSLSRDERSAVLYVLGGSPPQLERLRDHLLHRDDALP
jgi:hypothetical protein